ncbi:MAG TPA: tetratricopeptide repeat protein [Candidatus Binatia bacterium]|jgi:tetratricopeptide (TPR) repeat protein|nr:tetratricopeptide repeat protein [Candidatus Binatia bacterium]
MKRYCALVILVLLAPLGAAHAQALDDQYVQIFNLMQEADSLSTDRPAQALAKYVEAQTALQRMQRGNPEWNPKVVSFRLNYLNDRIAALSAAVPVRSASVPGETNRLSGTAPGATVPPTKPAVPGDWEDQLNTLKGQVHQLQAETIVLQTKLKEAFDLRPAEVDPREMAKAQEKITSLQKENDSLKVNLDKEKSKPAPVADTPALEIARKQLEEANRQLALQKDLASKLAQEKAGLQTRLVAVAPDAEAASALRAENLLLKKQLADLKNAAPAAGKADDAARQLAQAQAQLAALQSDKQILRLEKMALEGRVKQLNATMVTGTMPPLPTSLADANRIKQLEHERDDLQKKLQAATKELSARKDKAAQARVEDLENQLAIARARLQVFEARQVPYTPEELALFKTPEAKFADAEKGGRKSVHELPPEAAKLAVEAQGYFAARQFDKAEQTYLQVVRQDQKSVPALANLAAIQVEDTHYGAAEMNLKQALSLDPDNAYSLSVLGNLKFRQGKFDDALDALSRAAKLDPQNAEIQNYLGLALSEKGLRGPAEAALRKAIQLQPDYASAHNNLAVIYITQKPPAVELARWHYQRALSAGHPKNPELEKMLDGKATAQ